MHTPVTIYEIDAGQIPRRFNLTPRCVVWDLEEVEEWLELRRQASIEAAPKLRPGRMSIGAGNCFWTC